MPSTPKHLVIYNAFGWDAPKFAHVGLLQDVRKNKLSKRDFDNVSLDLRKLQNEGVFPEALLNYVALYGWSHSNKSDVMPMEELTKAVRFYVQMLVAYDPLTYPSSISNLPKAIAS